MTQIIMATLERPAYWQRTAGPLRGRVATVSHAFSSRMRKYSSCQLEQLGNFLDYTIAPGMHRFGKQSSSF
jgi:hypothetical protein